MTVVDNVSDFAKYNEDDIRLYLTSPRRGRGLYDPELVNDIIQNFYLRLLKSDALKKYDPAIGSFKTYVITILSNMLPQERKSNHSSRYKHLSSIIKPSAVVSLGAEESDIFNFFSCVGADTDFAVAQHKNIYSSLFQEEEDLSIRHFISFISHVKKTEPNKKKADAMVCFLENKMRGCLGSDIALMLGVSNNMVKIIKNNIYDKYKKWDNTRALSRA